MKKRAPEVLRYRWRTPENLSVSEWAEQYRYLAPETASEPGPWRNERTPYLRKIMDAFSDPYIERIVFNKGSQIGGSEAIYCMLGFAIHQDPASTLVVMPSIDLAKYVSRKRIQPMIECCPELKALKPSNGDDFTTLEMLFPSMVLTLAGANSPASLASRPCRYVFLDEVDKFPKFSGREADPISLATERQKTFWNRKTVITSTPTTEDGQITRELKGCDAVFDYWVPCPHCGAMQTLKFGQIKWPKDLDREDPFFAQRVKDTAWYECGHCFEPIMNLDRPRMLRDGEWRARSPGESTDEAGDDKKPRGKALSPRSVGFHLPSFYSSWLTWGDIAEEFVKSEPYPEKLMNVINSWFAEPWVKRVHQTSDSDILKAKTELPPQTCPEEVIALTAGIDCQKYGFWFVVRAWAKDYTSWLIHYGQLATWEDVEQLLFETEYKTADESRSYKIWRAAVDTGGSEGEHGHSMTEEAYWWIRRNGTGRGCRVWGTKGSSYPLDSKLKLGKVLDKTPSGKPIPGGLQLVLLDTGRLKDAFFYRLDLASHAQSMGAYLHSKVNGPYISHITAEEKRVDRKGVEQWVKLKARNDLLDCECMNLALADPEWPGGGVNLLSSQNPRLDTVKPQTNAWLPQRRSSWLGR